MGVGTVCRADLDQAGAALAHHVGDAETAADLDCLTARDDDAATGGDGGEDEEDGGGAVVDDERRLGAGQQPHQRGDLAHPAAALVRLRLQFERDIVRRGGGHRRCRVGADRRSPKVGVDHDAGRVDDRGQAGLGQVGQTRQKPLVDLGARWRAAGGDCRAFAGQMILREPSKAFNAQPDASAAGRIEEG